jgi:5-methylcytosine-specific restriction enzyme A
MKYCAEPRCPNLVERGRCPQHARQADRRRGTAIERGYAAQWSALSRRFRQQHPFCGERADGTRDAVNSECVRLGLDTPAECVDHTVPVTAGGAMFDEANLMSCCIACNTKKARTLERLARGGWGR